MSMARLKQIVVPPERPVEVPDDSVWDAVRALFGEIPADYREFVETYGTGCLCEFIWIYNPASPNEYLNLIK
jgi:hypothetical protein